MNDKDKTTGKNQFTIIDDNGKEIVYDVLFTFDSDETNKSYIVYTDNSQDENGNIQVFASVYYPGSDTSKLDPIETDKEWKIIETILDTIQEEMNNQDNTDEQ